MIQHLFFHLGQQFAQRLRVIRYRSLGIGAALHRAFFTGTLAALG